MKHVIAELGGVDLIIFDSVMSLIDGPHKDEDTWIETLPWLRSLTRRAIGQIWVHHTGWDESHSYGTNTREWEMDTVIGAERVKRDDVDISLLLKFRKARERTPDNRHEFEDVRVALLSDGWVWERASGEGKTRPSPQAVKFLDALLVATKQEVGVVEPADMFGEKAITRRPPATMHGCPAASIEQWKRACVGAGLLDTENGTLTKPSRTLFSNNKRELIIKNWIACNDTHAWVLS